MLTKGALCLGLQLRFVLLDLVTDHAAAILGFHLNLMLDLRQILLIFLFLLSLELENLAIGFFLHVALFFL